MPSGPKKRRAAAKKINDTVSKTSTNPAEDQAVAALEAVHEMVSMENKGEEYQTVDDQRITDIEAVPLIVNSSENVKRCIEPVDDHSVMGPSLIESSSMTKDVKEGITVKPIESVSKENPDIPTKEGDGSLKEPLKSDTKDGSSVDQNEKVGQENMRMLLEHLQLISNEISCNAEKQLTCSIKLSQLLEELKGCMGM